MPLDNTATVRDIITSLEDMQGINAKADLASVVGSPATADDSMTMITNTIQQAKNELASKTDQDNTEPLMKLIDGAGKFVKSIQSGFIQSLTTDIGSSFDIPINQVDMDKSVIIVDQVGSAVRYDSSSFIIDFLNSTTLNGKRVNNIAVNNLYINWYVVEFNDNVKIQKGLLESNMNVGLYSIPINDIDVSKAIPIVQARSTVSSTNASTNYFAKEVTLTSNSLELRFGASSNRDILYSIVEFP